MRGRKHPTLDLTPLVPGAPLTFQTMALAFLHDYQLHRYRSLSAARTRVEYLRHVFGEVDPDQITTESIRQYQWQRRQQGAEAATVNRETSVLNRMFHLAIERGQLVQMPILPKRLAENPPRQGFFEHDEFLKVRQHLPPSFRDVLDFAYYSGWRRAEILGLTWAEVDLPGGVIRLRPDRSKTKQGRVLPISPPLRQVLDRRRRQGRLRVSSRWRYRSRLADRAP